MVFVGATNVGSISLNFDKELKTNTRLRLPMSGSRILSYAKEKEHDFFQSSSVQKAISSNKTESKNDEVDAPSYAERQEGVFVPRGGEIGRFNMGSTIVLVFEAPKNIKWLVEMNDIVRYGQPIFRIEE